MNRPRADDGETMATSANTPGRDHEGEVVEQLPDALYVVRLTDSNRRVVAHIDASPRRNFVRLLPGDRVTVELTARNRTRGRITRRAGAEVGPGASAPRSG